MFGKIDRMKSHHFSLPSGFIFQFSGQEFMDLRSQIGISKRGGIRFMPMAFTEQYVAMFSGILKIDWAIEVNIQIMRAFTKLRHMITANEELKKEIGTLRGQTDERFLIVFETLGVLPWIHNLWRGFPAI